MKKTPLMEVLLYQNSLIFEQSYLIFAFQKTYKPYKIRFVSVNTKSGGKRK